MGGTILTSAGHRRTTPRRRDRLELQQRNPTSGRRRHQYRVYRARDLPVEPTASTWEMASARSPTFRPTQPRTPESAIYDPYDNCARRGGASKVAPAYRSPTWAGLIAVADQGRAEVITAGRPWRANPDPACAICPWEPTTIRRITRPISTTSPTATTATPAGPGYDLVTGIGSPQANNLLPALAGYGAATGAKVVIQPPEDVIKGGQFGTGDRGRRPQAPGPWRSDTMARRPMSLTSGGPGGAGRHDDGRFQQRRGRFSTISRSRPCRRHS